MGAMITRRVANKYISEDSELMSNERNDINIAQQNIMDYPGYVWPACILCCSGGLHNIVYAFGFGYGLSMAANGVMASLNFDITRFKSTGRWGAASFTEKAADIQERSNKMALLAKASITLFVGTLMATYHVSI
eukprot:jgi/Bigna1/144460/aug1.87_g19168